MSRRRIAHAAAVVVAAGIVSVQAASASAATIEVVDGTAVFTAAPGEANDVRAGTLAAPDTVSLKVIDAGAPLTAGPGCQQLDANSAWCPDPPAGPFQPLTMRLGDGNDRANVDDRGTRAVTIHGESGDDTIHFGSGDGTSPTLEGGSGDDDLSTTNNGEGTPVLRGGSGDDVLRIGGLGGGLAYGDDGADRLVYSALSGPNSTIRLDGGHGDDRYSFPVGYVPGVVVPGPGFDTLDQSAVTFLPLFIDMATWPRLLRARDRLAERRPDHRRRARTGDPRRRRRRHHRRPRRPRPLRRRGGRRHDHRAGRRDRWRRLRRRRRHGDGRPLRPGQP
jgi:hypothetical protein